MPAITHALKAHLKDGHVLRWAATAMLSLTADSAVRSHQAVAAGAEEALRKAVDAGQPVTACQRQQGTKTSRQRKPAWHEKVALAHRWLTMHGKLLAKPIMALTEAEKLLKPSETEKLLLDTKPAVGVAPPDGAASPGAPSAAGPEAPAPLMPPVPVVEAS